MSVGASHPPFVPLPPSVPHYFLFFDAFFNALIFSTVDIFVIQLSMCAMGSMNLQVSPKGDLYEIYKYDL